MQSAQELRACFPAVASAPDVLLDNAGGSQVPRHVADAMHRYMLNTYVQLGADYETSRESTSTVTFVKASGLHQRGMIVRKPGPQGPGFQKSP